MPALPQTQQDGETMASRGFPDLPPLSIHLHCSTLFKPDEDPMNDSISRLLHRRSVPPRWLGEPGPSEQEVETLLKVASRVPDHGKLVPWRFILIQGEGRGRLGEVLATAFQ